VPISDDVDDLDFVVDSAEHTVRTPSRRPAETEWRCQRPAHTTGIVGERAGDELEHGNGDTLRKDLLERQGGGTSDAEAIPRFTREDDRRGASSR
jgi:hypothetical protein